MLENVLNRFHFVDAIKRLQKKSIFSTYRFANLVILFIESHNKF